MGLWDAVAKARLPEQTINDDAISRLARRDSAERDRIKREEVDPETGRPLLWFDVSMSVLSMWIPMVWSGRDEDDVRDAVIEWIAADEWITVDFANNGAESRLTFRSSWLAGFTVGKGRRRA